MFDYDPDQEALDAYDQRAHDDAMRLQQQEQWEDEQRHLDAELAEERAAQASFALAEIRGAL